jgi:hypothetical protein
MHIQPPSIATTLAALIAAAAASFCSNYVTYFVPGGGYFDESMLGSLRLRNVLLKGTHESSARSVMAFTAN